MSALPPALADALRPVLGALAEDTIAAIGREVPDYARPLEGPFGRTLRAGVERALERFVDELGAAGDDHAGAAVYVALGRGERRAGRSLDALLSAYRLGARLAWERFQAAAVAAGHPPEVLYALAGAIFSYIDAISAESVAGYAEEQSRDAGERARRRRALARLLSREDVGAGEVADLAARAGWAVPATLAALALVTPDDAERVAVRLGVDVVAASEEDDVVLAWIADPDAPGRRRQLAAGLAARGLAALGPTLPAARAPRSALRARATLRAARAGHLGAQAGLVVADEHLVALLLHGDGLGLAADLATRELAPLDGLGGAARERALATLRAWLDQPGQVQRVAAVLAVHPQTVRYRMVDLRERFGDALEDPERRWTLGLALRVAG